MKFHISNLVAEGTGTLVDGKNLANGVVRGARNGAIGGASQSIAMIAFFGATYETTEEQFK